MHLLTDMLSFRLAPTLGREVLAQSLTFLCVAALALVLAEDPRIAYGAPIVFAVYAVARALLVAVRGPRADHPAPDRAD